MLLYIIGSLFSSNCCFELFSRRKCVRYEVASKDFVICVTFCSIALGYNTSYA